MLSLVGNPIFIMRMVFNTDASKNLPIKLVLLHLRVCWVLIINKFIVLFFSTMCMPDGSPLFISFSFYFLSVIFSKKKLDK